MQLHVINVFQRTIASLLFAPISWHNDRLRCEPPLITHYDIKPFQLCPQNFEFFFVLKIAKLWLFFRSIVSCKHPLYQSFVSDWFDVHN
jgi:hypothetical protein